ncbi:MAG: ABC transporter permease, partial [Phycisphaerales bacterium JB038]
WVVVALFLLVSGVVFSLQVYLPAQPATLRAFFSSAVWMFSFIIPAVTMRSLASEYRQGTIESLLTSPVADWEVIFGKFLAAFGVVAAMLAPTLLYAVLLGFSSDLELGPIVSGYLGLLLLGAMYTALGVLASTTTQSLMAAYLGAFFFWLVVGFVTTQGAATLGESWGAWLYAASPRRHMAGFAKGVIDFAAIVYFLSLTALFLLLAVRLLESKRWR